MSTDSLLGIWQLSVGTVAIGLSVWAAVCALRQKETSDDFEPLLDQFGFFFLGLVASWIAAACWWWIADWSTLWQQGSPCWLPIALLSIAPSVIHAIITSIRFPRAFDWWEHILPPIILAFWLYIGPWVGAVLLVATALLCLAWLLGEIRQRAFRADRATVTR